MNTNTDRDATRTTGRARARRIATLSVAGVLAGLALAPTSAFADHPTSGGSGESTTPSGDRWSYMYDVAQRKEAMARVQESHEAQAGSNAGETGPHYANAWSYMYDAERSKEEAIRHRTPPAKRHDSVLQRKAHPALANIVVSVTPSDPATCYLPDTLDPGTRRLIAVQLCSDAQIVPAVFLARAATYEQASKSVYSLGHL
ncbi:MAG: hypothetical protein ABWX84_04575 [Nocardioides sp.]